MKWIRFVLRQGGRQDPVVKLKKQLAEKEKALSDEQEAHQAIQNKLKELRTELNAEKHANRELAETINARQADLQTLNTRVQTISDEKQNFARQVQQVNDRIALIALCNELSWFVSIYLWKFFSFVNSFKRN